MFVVIVLVLLVAAVSWLLTFLHTKRLVSFWTTKGVSFTPKKQGLLKRILFQANLVQLDDWIYNSPGQSDFPFSGASDEFEYEPMIYVRDPELIRQICVKDYKNFINRRMVKNMDSLPTMKIFSQMLFFQQNRKWKDLRVKMSPTFTTRKIRRMFHIFNTSSVKLVQQFRLEFRNSKTETRNGKLFAEMDFEPICWKYTIDVIASAAFGLEACVFENDIDKPSIFLTMAKKLQALTIFNFSTIAKFALVVLFPTLVPRFKRLFEDSEKVQMYFANIIRSAIYHRKIVEEDEREDFIQLMIESQIQNVHMQCSSADEASEPSDTEIPKGNNTLPQTSSSDRLLELTDDIIAAQCMQFFIAGSDTTQSALVFAPYLLALNLECQQRLFDALSGAGEISYDMVNQNQYLDQIIQECLRMYPPGIRIERKVSHDYKLPGTDLVLPAGTPVLIPVFQLHHDPKHYPDPEKFDPERFSPEIKSKRSPFVYLPFGAGQKICIANRFATMELKTALVHLVLNFKFEPCQKTTIPMQFKVSSSLKPICGMWLRIEER